jgi:hypothetical protein
MLYLNGSIYNEFFITNISKKAALYQRGMHEIPDHHSTQNGGHIMVRLILVVALASTVAACAALNYNQPPFPQQNPVTGVWGPDNTNP